MRFLSASSSSTATRLGAVVLSLVMLAAACGGSDGTDALADAANDAVDAANDTSQDLIEATDDLVEELEETQAALGGGGFTITVDGNTWTFDSVLCAFGEEQIGQEGAEFVLSSLQDGLQAYVSIDSFGESVSLDDIEDFENPSVSLTSFDPLTINLDGKNVSGNGTFFDNTSDTGATVPGTFEGTCP